MWYVFADPALVEAGQVLAFETALEAQGIVYGRNARALQPLGERYVSYYGFSAGGKPDYNRQTSVSQVQAMWHDRILGELGEEI